MTECIMCGSTEEVRHIFRNGPAYCAGCIRKHGLDNIDGP